ncbi:MAG: hypothetical protein KBF31_04695 [Chitinophagales bacterium]|nr:hypothetical protein [Chitinophagales bacterium]
MRQIDPSTLDRRIRYYGFLVFGFILIALFYRFMGNNLLFQLGNPPLKNPGIDNTYWLLHLLSIPQILMEFNLLKYIVDFLLLFFTFISLVAYIKRPSAISLFIVLFIYLITVQSYTANQNKTSVALLLMVIPFMVKQEHFFYIWEALRYYLLFMIGSSGIYKLINGALFSAGHFSDVLFLQHTDLMVMNPEHFSLVLSKPFIENGFLGTLAFFIVFLVQTSFIVGFFTKKFDKLLFVSLYAFFILTYLFMRIQNFEFLILGFTLLKSRDVNFAHTWE